MWGPQRFLRSGGKHVRGSSPLRQTRWCGGPLRSHCAAAGRGTLRLACCSSLRLEGHFTIFIINIRHSIKDRLVGQVVTASASRAEDPGFESRLRRDFSGSSHTGDLKIGTPVVTLPGAWRYRVSAGTGRPGVSILCLGEMESLICSFYLRVAARKIV